MKRVIIVSPEKSEILLFSSETSSILTGEQSENSHEKSEIQALQKS